MIEAFVCFPLHLKHAADNAFSLQMHKNLVHEIREDDIALIFILIKDIHGWNEVIE